MHMHIVRSSITGFFSTKINHKFSKNLNYLKMDTSTATSDENPSGTTKREDPDPDLTLAQQIAENERQMYDQSQRMLEEIEDEVLLSQDYL
jgi:hypothetical protein